MPSPRLRGPRTPERTDPRPLRLLALIGSPIALATGLLLFFGWTRERAEAQAFGYDVSVTGMSVRDFVLKSVLILYLPVLVLLVAAIPLAWGHQQLIRGVQRNPRLRRLTAGAAEILIASWSVWLVVGLSIWLFGPSLRPAAIPAVLTVALLSALYGDHLRRHLRHRDALKPTLRVLVVATLVFAVFWDVERIAGAVGTAYAAEIASDPRQLVAATVYSPQRLDIDVAGVTETRVGDPGSAYHYRYDGLRLLQVSGGHYFLISQSWDTGHRRVLVIPASDTYRVEFSR